MHYPAELHDLQNDYPLAPERYMLNEIYEYSYNFYKKYNIKPNKTEKLMTSLCYKTEYICHYQYLKMLIEQGLIVTKIYCVL